MPEFISKVYLSEEAQLIKAIADADFIKGGFRTFLSSSDFVDIDIAYPGNNNVYGPQPIGEILQDRQIVFAQDTHKLYQFDYQLALPTFGEDGSFQGLSTPIESWKEFQFSGSSTGITDPITAQNITINDGGSGTKLELLDDQTLNITAQSVNPIVSITSASLGLEVNSKGLVELSDFDYVPSVGSGGEVLYTTIPESHLIASSSAFYLSVPELPNLLTSLNDPLAGTGNGFSTFTQSSDFGFENLLSAGVTTNSLKQNKLFTNLINVEQGQTFNLSFTINTNEAFVENLLFNTRISMFSSLNLQGNIYPLQNIGFNSFTITSTITAPVTIGFQIINSTLSYSIFNVKLIQTGL